MALSQADLLSAGEEYPGLKYLPNVKDLLIHQEEFQPYQELNIWVRVEYNPSL